MTTAIEAIMNLAKALDVTGISALPGAWEQKIDDTWYLAINGKDHEVAVEPENAMKAEIPPYHFCVWYNGWVAALFHPYGGMFAAGEGANEDTFAVAVEEFIRQKEIE